MFNLSNPMLHGDGTGNMYDPEEGRAEMGANSNHVPTLMAGAVIGGGLVLVLLKHWGFDVGVSAKASGGGR